MYIDLSSLAYGTLTILGAAALVLLIMNLIKLFKVISRFNGILEKNEKNINSMLISLPKASNNAAEISENIKVVTEVVTDTTASAIKAKENINDYVTIIKDILTIIKEVFSK